MNELLNPQTLKWVAIAVGVAIVLWPQLQALLSKFKVSPSTERVIETLTQGSPKSVGFNESVLALGEVRRRVDSTGTLDDATQKAFVVITENLVAGASK
jgi:hypothetical protein